MAQPRGFAAWPQPQCFETADARRWTPMRNCECRVANSEGPCRWASAIGSSADSPWRIVVICRRAGCSRRALSLVPAGERRGRGCSKGRGAGLRGNSLRSPRRVEGTRGAHGQGQGTIRVRRHAQMSVRDLWKLPWRASGGVEARSELRIMPTFPRHTNSARQRNVAAVDSEIV